MRLFKNISSFTSLLPIQSYSIVRPGLKGNPENRPVLLTFDDGPNHIDDVSMSLLSVLKKHNVKVIFCLIGKNVKQHPHIVKQMHADGHVIANHGHKGDPFIFKRMKNISEDIDACSKAICEAIENQEHRVEYFRPGYGAYFSKHKPFWESRNMQLLPVTDFFFDHKIKPSGMEKLVAQFTDTVRKNHGGVYVLHDGRNEHQVINSRMETARSRRLASDYDRSWVPFAVDKILTELKNEGFKLPALNDGHNNQLHPEFKRFLFPE